MDYLTIFLESNVDVLVDLLFGFLALAFAAREAKEGRSVGEMSPLTLTIILILLLAALG